MAPITKGVIMHKQRLSISTANVQQQALLLTYASTAAPKRLLLLHGAGVPGETTWTYLANYLTEWDEVLIPDFAGMGGSAFLHNDVPNIHHYVQQIDELLTALNWQEFDIAGYSFGGMVTERYLRTRDFSGLCFLIEPAMLFSGECDLVTQKAQDYVAVAEAIEQNPTALEPYRQFLDTVSPHRSKNEQAEALTLKRLQQDAAGFACALRAVSNALLDECDYFTAWRSPYIGASFVGGLSVASMHERHQRLQQESANWLYVSVDGADHSLVFTRPRKIAEVINNTRKRINAEHS